MPALKPSDTPLDPPGDVPNPTGSRPDPTKLKVSVTVKESLWIILQEVARDMDVTPKWALENLLRRVEHLLVDERSDALGFEYAQARDKVMGEKGPVAPAQPTTPTGGKINPAVLASIDDERLQRSTKLKSGYAGVYPNGSGYAARGPSATYIGTYRTAREAAQARFLYYQTRGMPYGDLAERVAEMLRDDVTLKAQGVTDPEWVKRVAIFEAAQFGSPFPGLTREEKVWESRDPWKEILGGGM